MYKIKVFAKRPDSNWYVTNVSNTLENLQRFVEGYIETATVAKDVVVICNEEGLIRGMPRSCTILNHDFFGPVLIAGVDGDEFADVPITFAEAKAIGLCKD